MFGFQLRLDQLALTSAAPAPHPPSTSPPPPSMMAATTWGPQPPCPEHTHAYRIVSDFFQRHRRDVVEIEVLPPAIAPPSGSPVLEDGLCLGVPKRLLAAAFIAACSIFFDKRASSDPSSVEAALDATSVILLFDPEHLTAANFRRSQLNILSPLHNVHHVQLELNFLDSILTSPLHRQSKSPTLWGYRAWIMQSFDPWLLLSRARDKDVGSASSWEHFSCELGVVLKAGERHPKNYYAWQYARRLCDRIFEWQDFCLHKFPSQYPYPITPTHDLWLQSVPVVHDWCLRNPSDTSAWSFLHFLLLRIPERTQLAQQTVDKTLHLAQDFHWKHESLWTFLRTVIADSTLISADVRHQYLLAMESIYKRKEGSPSRAKSITITVDHPAENAVLWILRNATV